METLLSVLCFNFFKKNWNVKHSQKFSRILWGTLLGVFFASFYWAIKYNTNIAFAEKIAPPEGYGKQKQNVDAIDTLFKNLPENSISDGVIETKSSDLGLPNLEDKSSDRVNFELRRKQFQMRQTDKEFLGEGGAQNKTTEKIIDLDKNMGSEIKTILGDEEKTPSFLLGVQKIKNLFAKRNFEDCLFEVNQLLKFYPQSYLLLTMKGTVLQRLGQIDLSLKCYKKAFEIEPSAKLKAQIEAVERLISERQNLKALSSPAKGIVIPGGLDAFETKSEGK